MEKLLTGKRILLRPLTINDKDLFYSLTIESDATDQLYRKIRNEKIPNRKELFDDYTDTFFVDTNPDEGRCFGINYHDQIIGQVNYNAIDRNENSTEIDIWIADEKNTNQGLGSEALAILMNYLTKKLKVFRFVIFPDKTNHRAIRSYQKAGFKIIKEIDSSVLMEKNVIENSNIA